MCHILSSVQILCVCCHLDIFSDCEALTVGNHNVLEAKSKCHSAIPSLPCKMFTGHWLGFVGRRVTVTDGCVIGAKCRVDVKETVSNNTVIFGEKCVRRKQASHPPVRIIKQLHCMAVSSLQLQAS